MNIYFTHSCRVLTELFVSNDVKKRHSRMNRLINVDKFIVSLYYNKHDFMTKHELHKYIIE